MTDKIPTLQTLRLNLRPFDLSDAKEVQRLAGNAMVAATTATIPHPYPDGVAEEWISSHGKAFECGVAVDWAIEIQSSKQLIGCISFGVNKANCRAELGYWVGEDYWNHGYCTEAARAAINYAFITLKLNKVTSRHIAENPSSGKVMIKAGMTQEGILKKDFLKNGKFVDMVVYGILNPNV